MEDKDFSIKTQRLFLGSCKYDSEFKLAGKEFYKKKNKSNSKLTFVAFRDEVFSELSVIAFRDKVFDILKLNIPRNKSYLARRKTLELV